MSLGAWSRRIVVVTDQVLTHGPHVAFVRALVRETDPTAVGQVEHLFVPKDQIRKANAEGFRVALRRRGVGGEHLISASLLPVGSW